MTRIPQNADTARLINWFDDFDGPNKYGFLSNFYIGGKFDMGDGLGAIYRTGEHAFQAYKATTEGDFNRVVTATSPGVSKARGRKVKLRRDWELVKYDVMRAVLNAKFAAGRPEADLLLRTGDALLVEGTDWGDKVWGVLNENGYGRNWLGELLMARRAVLRSGALFAPISGAVLAFSVPSLKANPRTPSVEVSRP